MCTWPLIEMQLLLRTKIIVIRIQLLGDVYSVTSAFKLSFHLTFARNVVLRYTDSAFVSFAGRILTAMWFAESVFKSQPRWTTQWAYPWYSTCVSNIWNVRMYTRHVHSLGSSLDEGCKGQEAVTKAMPVKARPFK